MGSNRFQAHGGGQQRAILNPTKCNHPPPSLAVTAFWFLERKIDPEKKPSDRCTAAGRLSNSYRSWSTIISLRLNKTATRHQLITTSKIPPQFNDNLIPTQPSHVPQHPNRHPPLHRLRRTLLRLRPSRLQRRRHRLPVQETTLREPPRLLHLQELQRRAADPALRHALGSMQGFRRRPQVSGSVF